MTNSADGRNIASRNQLVKKKERRRVTNISELAPEALLPITQVARVMNIHRSHVIRLMSNGDLPIIMVGTQRRVPYWAIRRFQETRIEEINRKVQALK